MEYRFGRSSKHPPFPPSPLQKYLATPRLKPSYKSRSYQYHPRPMHKITYLNGQKAKVYNTAWLYPDVESPGSKVDLFGKKHQLLLITHKRFGSAHDLSSTKRSPSALESPTSQSYSSLSVPSSKAECGLSPNDIATRSESGFSLTQSELDNSFVMGDDETGSISSVDRSFDRSLDNLGVFPMVDLDNDQFETDSVMSFDRTLDVVYEDENSDPDQETNNTSKKPNKTSASVSLLSRFEQSLPGGLASDDEVFRQHTDTLFISDGTNVQMEDVTEKQHGRTVRKSDGDDRLREHIDNLYIYDGSNSHIEDVPGTSRGTQRKHYDNDGDVVWHHTDTHYISDGSHLQIEDEESHHTPVASDDENFRHHTDTLYISSGSNEHLDHEVQPQRHDIAVTSDEDTFRQHTDTLYISDGSNIQIEDVSNRNFVASGNQSSNILREPSRTLYVPDPTNPQQDVVRQIPQSSQQHGQLAEQDDNTLRQHTETLYIFNGANSSHQDSLEDTKTELELSCIQTTDPVKREGNSERTNIHGHTVSSKRDTNRNVPSFDNDDNVREHTETLYINGGPDIHFDDSESTHSTTVKHLKSNRDTVAGAVSPEDVRHHTETLYFADGANVHQDDTSQSTEPLSSAEELGHHTDTLYFHDGANILINDDPQSQKAYPATEVKGELRTHTEIVKISQTADVHQHDSLKNVPKTVGTTGVRHGGEDIRRHTDTVYIFDGDNVLTNDDIEIRKVSPVADTEDRLRRHTDTITISHRPDIHKTDQPGSLSRFGPKSKFSDIQSDNENVRHDTETLYIHQGANEILGEANERQRAISGELEDDVWQHDTETIYITESGNVVDTEDQMLDSASDESDDEESDEEQVNQHRQIVYISDEGTKGASSKPDSIDTDIISPEHKDLKQHDSKNGYVEVVNVKVDDLAESTDMLAVSDEKIEIANSDFEDIGEMEVSAIEKSEEFEIIEMPEPVFSSSLVEDYESRHRYSSRDSSGSDDLHNDSGPIYSHNISAEYERADHESFEEFIDEREATTSSQVHLAEEDSDSDQFEGQRSDNEIIEQSSDDEFDNLSSHRQLTQSGSNSSTNTGELINSYSVSVETNVNDLNQNTNTEQVTDYVENVTSVRSDKTLTVGNNLVTQTSPGYSVIQLSSGPVDNMSDNKENMDTSEIGEDTNRDADRLSQFWTETGNNDRKSDSIYEAKHKAPHSLTDIQTDTLPMDGKFDTRMRPEIDEVNSSSATNWKWEPAGKKGEDSQGVKNTIVKTEDNSLNQDESMLKTADQLSSCYTTQADIKMNIDSDRGGTSTNSMRNGDNVEEQYATVGADGEGERPEIHGAEVSDKTIHTTRHEAKVELAKNELTAHVVAGEERALERESIDTLNVRQHHPGTNTDVVSQGIGNSQQLLETENVDFSSSSRQADQSLPDIGLSGRCHKEAAHQQNINSEGRIGVKLEELKKNSGEGDFQVQRVENTDPPNKLPIRKSESGIRDDIGYLSDPAIRQGYAEESKQFVNESSRIVVHPGSESLHENTQLLDGKERHVVHLSHGIVDQTVYDTASTDVSSGSSESGVVYGTVTHVRHSNGNTSRGRIVDSLKEKFIENPTQLDQGVSNFDDVGISHSSTGSIPEQCDIVNATGGVLNRTHFVEGDNNSMLHIDESQHKDLKGRVNNSLGYLENMADTKVSSAEMQVVDDKDKALNFTDRTEITVPVEKKAFIQTKVQYTVTKLKKTVTKTDVDVKKVQKNTTGDSVEHEHLRKVEQLTIVSQKVWSSTESLDTDEPAKEKVKVKYNATYDVTKSKDGHQLPSAHHETGFTGELPTDRLTQQALNGESEDILALCDPVTDIATSSRTNNIGFTHGIIIDNPPECQTSEIIQRGKETELQVQSKEGEVRNTQLRTVSDEDLKSLQSSTDVVKSKLVMDSVNDAKTVRGESPQTSVFESSNNMTKTGDTADLKMPVEVSGDKTVTCVTSQISDIPSGDTESPAYTDRTETFSSPITLSPVTVRRRRWSTDRKFTDDKLICTLYEDTVSGDVPERKDDALYILEDNIHVLNNATDRTEDFVTLTPKKSFKRPAPVRKPIWTYDLASLTVIDYNGQLGETESSQGRVILPYSPTDSEVSESDALDISENKLENVEEQNSSADYDQNKQSLTHIVSELEEDVKTGTISSVTVTSISHTSEIYDDNVSKTQEKRVSPSEARVRSLPSTDSSKLTPTGDGDENSPAWIPDTADVVKQPELPEKHYTSYEETDPYVDDTENNDLFLGGGWNERPTDTSGQNESLLPTKDTQIELKADGTENKQLVTENSDLVKVKLDDINEEVNKAQQTLAVLSVKTDTHYADEREKEELTAESNFWTDNNSNILQVKEAGTVVLKQGDDRQYGLSEGSQVMPEYREMEDRNSVLNQEEIYTTLKDKKTDLCPEDENSVTALRTYGNKDIVVREGQGDLSSGVETNTDSVHGGKEYVSSATWHSVPTDHLTQGTRISTYAAGSNNESNIFPGIESTSRLSAVDDKPSHSGETEDIQRDYTSGIVVTGVDGTGGHHSHAIATTDLSRHRVFTSSQEENASLYRSGTAIETGEGIDDQQTNLSALHSAVDSANTSDGLAYSGHTEVGKLNVETNRQNALSLQSVTADDGMLINSQNLVVQHAGDQKYANVTRALGGNEFASEGNVGFVSELETFGGRGRGLNTEREVTVTGELDVSVVNSTASEDESPDYDRENRIKEFSEAFRKYSIEELPAQENRRINESIPESRVRLTSVTDGQSEEIEYSSKMSHFDYDDWSESEAAQEQLRLNRSAEDGLKLQDEFSQCSDSSFVKMDDISSSDEINRSMGSDQLDRLDWLESQVHTDNSGQWQESSTNRSVLVTGQVEYDSDMEENNNYVKEMETSYAEDSDNSDMDTTSESQYSTTMTCEYKDEQTPRTISPSSTDERFTSFNEHMLGKSKEIPPEGKSRLLSSASSDGYFPSASEQATGELRLNVSFDTFRHFSSTSCEGYQSFISDQMTGELKHSPSSDSQKLSSPLSDEQRELEMIESDLKETLREFESWSDQLSGDVIQGGDKTRSISSDQRTGIYSVTDQTQTVHQFSPTTSGPIYGQVKYDKNQTQQDGFSSEQKGRLITQGHSTMVVANTGTSDIGVEKLDQLTLTQKYTSSDHLTHQLKGDTEIRSRQLSMGGKGIHVQITPEEQRLQQRYSSSDQRSNEMTENEQKRVLSPSIVVTGVNKSSEVRQKSQIFIPSPSSSEQTVRQTVTYTQEQETYENVPESISEKVKTELLQKSHGYFASSVSVNLSKKWKLFEKLFHSFDEFSWKGNLAPHLFTFVFQKAVENQTDAVTMFEKLYPLLLIEDVDRCQNHICTVLYTDIYLKQRKMQKYFLRGFTKDLKYLWNTKRRQSLSPMCDIPEERIVSFSDSASVSLATCHTTSIHPSMVSFHPVSKTQFNRFIQVGDTMDSRADVQKVDKSVDSGEDNSSDSLQYICQGDLSDPTIMLSKRLRDLSRGDDTEILDDVLLRGLRHYRSKFIRFNPYVQIDVRKTNGRKQIFPRNETIYEEEEDERYMN